MNWLGDSLAGLVAKAGVGTLLILSFVAKAEAFDHSHQKWTSVLSQYQVNGEFRYGKLKGEEAKGGESGFRRYLAELNGVSGKAYEEFSRAQKMAFLINAYNALTVKLIVDHYPVKSIKDTGTLFTKPWSIKFFDLLDGAIKSLDPIEHEYLRPKFSDYRIHAAVNCASKSCPELREDAFVPEKLDAQLDDQMGRWLTDPHRNRVDHTSKTIYLSKIFDWYGKDFESTKGGINSVLVKHATGLYKDAVARGYGIKFLDYDWDLNEPTNRK